MGRSKINPFLEQGVFDDDEKEEEKSELLTSMNVDEENSEGPTWLNVRQVQLPSSGKIIPVRLWREIEKNPVALYPRIDHHGGRKERDLLGSYRGL